MTSGRRYVTAEKMYTRTPTKLTDQVAGCCAVPFRNNAISESLVAATAVRRRPRGARTTGAGVRGCPGVASTTAVCGGGTT